MRFCGHVCTHTQTHTHTHTQTHTHTHMHTLFLELAPRGTKHMCVCVAMYACRRFVASGAHMDHLTLDALGTPVLETMVRHTHTNTREHKHAHTHTRSHVLPLLVLSPFLSAISVCVCVCVCDTQAPVLHHLAARVSQTLNLTVAPDLYLAPPHITPHKPISLLHIPHVSNAALMGHTPAAPRLADGTFGWRRRAVLVLSRRVVESFCTLPVATMPIPSGGVIGGSSKSDIGTVLAQSQSPYTAGEVVALLAAALAPLALPGGGGWRLSLHVARGGAVGAGNAGVGPGGALAVADAITAVSLAHVAPNALVPHLPVQLRVKWARVFAVLNRVDRAVQGVGDRAALLCCGNVEDVLTAVHKSLRATNVTPAPSDIAQEVSAIVTHTHTHTHGRVCLSLSEAATHGIYLAQVLTRRIAMCVYVCVCRRLHGVSLRSRTQAQVTPCSSHNPWWT